jgi:hypothetical protein
MCIEEVLDSQNVCCVPKFSLSESKGEEDHSDEQQPPKVTLCAGQILRADCGVNFQQHVS